MRPCLAGGVLCLVSAAALANAAGESHEAVIKDMLGEIEQINKALSAVKDRESADAKKPELKKSAEKLLELRKQAEQLREPAKAEKDRLAKEYGPKMEEAIKKLRDEAVRVRFVAGGNEALAELTILEEKGLLGKEAKDKKDGPKKAP
jgi:hypothetical protein